jgi:hypothetical protein
MEASNNTDSSKQGSQAPRFLKTRIVTPLPGGIPDSAIGIRTISDYHFIMSVITRRWF